MFLGLLKFFAGSHHRRFLRRSAPLVRQIHVHQKGYAQLTDDQLKAKTLEFRERVAQGASLDDLLPEAFATVREAARRLVGTQVEVCGHNLTWNMVHFDVQLIGGIALHQRKIAEMSTGEGKTLVATLPLYLNALASRNCQLVTVNDYLARRDSEWMGHLFKWLGLTVGCIQNQMSPAERRAAYGCDITYATASELGFDYLRDNGMAFSADEQVQREHFYCIVDEVDSILVDEARTPLIISGPVPEEREPAFPRLKPDVAQLIEHQVRLVNRLMTEAEAALKKLGPTEEVPDDVADKLWLAAHGMPRNRILLRLLESGRWRKALERREGILASELEKTRKYVLKEQLYFAVSERNHEADLTQIGRDTLRPGQPDAFVLPDIASAFVAIEAKTSLTPAERAEQKQAAEAGYIKASEDIHAIGQLLRAYALYERDVHYVVQDDKVYIVDEHTGRILPGRRWSDGLHQAVECKENVPLERETKTYATITIQNYFRLYEKLAGMTGTAETEASEFNDIYGLGVVAIPTHRDCIRVDENDIVFKTRREKFAHAIQLIAAAHAKGQPVLVGTASVESSETLSGMLEAAKVPHKVLNAKQHALEADIIARAGQQGAVTIATNMAGRGTDIKLGEGVAELGGLFVLATERHESRRVDRQLRGRCSRQGDPGRSRFLVSLEDDLMRLFANAGTISNLLEKSFKEGDPLEHPLLNWSITTAQKRVEAQNYTIRKRLLQYDDVLNRQREVIYAIRNGAIRAENPRPVLLELIAEEINERVAAIFPDPRGPGNRQAAEDFVAWASGAFPVRITAEELLALGATKAGNEMATRVSRLHAEREQYEEAQGLRSLERQVVLRAVDRNWQDHLTEMEDLRRSVGLRGYAQKDPLNEYKAEAFRAFGTMLGRLRSDACTGLFRMATSLEAFEETMRRARGEAVAVGPGQVSPKAATAKLPAAPTPKALPVRRDLPKIGRNALVRIRKGDQTQDLKWKKAEPLVREEGWSIETVLSE